MEDALNKKKNQFVQIPVNPIWSESCFCEKVWKLEGRGFESHQMVCFLFFFVFPFWLSFFKSL